MKILIQFLSVLAISHLVNAKTIDYGEANQKFTAEFFSTLKSNQPSIILIHNWMGITEETIKQAKRFQALGYNVFVADVYGKGVRPKNAEEASKLANDLKTDRKTLRNRLHLAYQELLKQKNIDPKRIAILGYCFGGTAALEAGRNGEVLKAIISFHGGLDSPTPLDGANIKAKVLALHGAIDPFVPAKDIEAFEREMQSHNVNYELIKYSGTVHSFTEKAAGNDISKGAAYNQESDERSFARAKDFLAENLLK